MAWSDKAREAAKAARKAKARNSEHNKAFKKAIKAGWVPTGPGIFRTPPKTTKLGAKAAAKLGAKVASADTRRRITLKNHLKVISKKGKYSASKLLSPKGKANPQPRKKK